MRGVTGGNVTPITQILRQWCGGGGQLPQSVMRDLYPELVRLASAQLQYSHPDATLNTRALVHEAYAKLTAGQSTVSSRAHFMALAGRVMRQVIVDYSRRRLAERRGGRAVHVSIEQFDANTIQESPESIAIIADLMDHLGRFDEALVQVIDCRLFLGLSLQETATAMKVSERSVQRYWVKAQAWLRHALGELDRAS